MHLSSNLRICTQRLSHTLVCDPSYYARFQLSSVFYQRIQPILSKSPPVSLTILMVTRKQLTVVRSICYEYVLSSSLPSDRCSNLL